MFEIVNWVAYKGQMINCTLARESFPFPESHWIDVPSVPSSSNWLPAEGEALKELLGDLSYRMVGYASGFSEVFLISSFRAVVNQIVKYGRNRLYAGITAGTYPQGAWS